MGKAVDNSVLDAALDKIATATAMHACSAEPANHAGIAAVSLADVTIDGSDFTNADGDTSGRKTTVAQQTNVTVDATGTANHIALTDGTTLLYVTTATSQAVTSGNTMTINSFKIEIADPS